MAEEQGTHNTEISDSDKLSEIGNILRDAMKRFDSIEERMDALESRKRADAEEAEVEEPGEPVEPSVDEDEEDCDTPMRGDRGRKDADEEEEEREDDEEEKEEESMADARHDSLVAELAMVKAKLARLTPRNRDAADRERFAAIQEQAEPAFQAFSDRAPAPMEGETPTDYKRRLASKLKKHSKRWSTHRLDAVSDEGILNNIVEEIYADSIAAARRGVEVAPGELREIVSRSAAGHTRIEFQGDPSSWMNNLAGDSMRGTGKFMVPA